MGCFRHQQTARCHRSDTIFASTELQTDVTVSRTSVLFLPTWTVSPNPCSERVTFWFLYVFVPINLIFNYRLMKLTAIGLAVIATFVVCWLPFLWSLNDAGQVLHRLFPFARGIFEDKVANIWCTLNVLVKLRNWNIGALAMIRFVVLFFTDNKIRNDRNHVES